MKGKYPVKGKNVVILVGHTIVWSITLIIGIKGHDPKLSFLGGFGLLVLVIALVSKMVSSKPK